LGFLGEQAKEQETTMYKTLFALGAVTAITSSGAFAQHSAVMGAAGDAVSGEIGAAPVGGAVGGAASVVAGIAIDPPPERVSRYVSQVPISAHPLVVEKNVAVGATLPKAIVVQEIPADPRYVYAFVNEQRLIVEPLSRKIVQVVD
jgi:hypothetical protein